MNNNPNLNKLIKDSNILLKLLIFFLIVLSIYTITNIMKLWGIFSYINLIIKVLTPLLIGFIYTWILNPLVEYLESKNIKRTIGAIIVTISFIIIIYLFFSFIIPEIINQVQDFIRIIPSILKKLNVWLDYIIVWLNDFGINTSGLKKSILSNLTNYQIDTKFLIDSITNIASFIFTIVISLTIGFYLLIDYHGTLHVLTKLFPKKYKKDCVNLICQINTNLYSYK